MLGKTLSVTVATLVVVTITVDVGKMVISEDAAFEGDEIVTNTVLAVVEVS